MSQISDTTGTVATYAYYTSTSLLKTVTYNDGSKYEFEYDDTAVSGKYFLTTVKDALDNILEAHEYDSSGRATTSERHGGIEEFTFEYGLTHSTYGTYTKVTDADERVTNYFYERVYGTNILTHIFGECSSCGSGSEHSHYEYDRSNSWLNLKKKTDALGHETVYTYDSERNITSITDILGRQTFTYNSFGQVLVHTDRMGGETTNTYDTAGNLLETEDPLDNPTTFTYTTAYKQLETITDARDNTTTLDYDSYGRLEHITDANNKTTDLEYNARAQVISVTNAEDETTSFEYDDNNRLEKIVYEDTSEINIEYDLAGRRTSVTDENGHETTYAYDEAYRLTGVTDALSHTTTFGYDTMSNLTSQTDDVGNTTSYEYDSFNRLKKIVYPAPTASATPLYEEFTYNDLGEIETHKDTAGRTTSYAYTYSPNPTPAPTVPSSVKRIVTITQPTPLGYTTQLTYDARMQLTKVKDALNQEYTFAYDALGRLTSQSPRVGSTPMSFTYDEVGNRTGRTDYNGNTTSYTYDDLNRLTNINYTGASGENVTYSYDDVSRLTEAANYAGTVAFTYDNRGRLASETDVFGHVMGYSYDLAGNRTSLTFDSNPYTTYEYDDANRLTTLTDGDSNAVTFGYDDANRLISKILPNGVTTSFEYDGMSRLKRLKHEDSGPTTLYEDHYTYNTANQISQIAGLSQTRNFTYDNINRLTGMTDGTNTETYTYDAVGNRTMTGYTTGVFNRLTAANGSSYTYNANGSMTSSSTVGYAWDRENRLVTASASSGDATQFQYDALGRRTSSHFVPYLASTEDPVPTNFTYDGQDVILDDNGGLDPSSIYYKPSVYYQNALGIDNKIGMNDGRAKYFMQDHLGSTVGLTNANGSWFETNSYDSFGNPSNSSFGTRYQFTGREFDTFSGLQYSRARFYDPQIGRFISEDPIGFAGGDVNLYGYVRNNPFMFTDPTGLQVPTPLPYPTSRSSECGCNKNSDDVNKIKNVFDSSVYRMTYTGQRHVNPYWNNFASTFGASYLGCGLQADIATSDLQIAFPDGRWQFHIETGFTPLFHQWGVGNSRNPDDPVIKYDPWKDKITIKCRCEQ